MVPIQWKYVWKPLYTGTIYIAHKVEQHLIWPQKVIDDGINVRKELST